LEQSPGDGLPKAKKKSTLPGTGPRRNEEVSEPSQIGWPGDEQWRSAHGTVMGLKNGGQCTFTQSAKKSSKTQARAA